MKSNHSARWLFAPYMMVLLLYLTSCFQAKKEDLPIFESFQISNMSSHTANISFYAEGAPKTVYTKIYSQSSPIYVTKETAEINATLVRSNVSVSIPPGQMALFFAPFENYTEEPVASSLQECGFGKRYFDYFKNQNLFMGDSATISKDGMQESELPIKDYARWETWYDDQNFIYYHFWRIE